MKAKKMSSYNELELKGHLLNLIAQTNDRTQLLQFVEVIESILEQGVEEDAETFWRRYTPEQRAKLERSFEESYDPANWIPHEEMMKKHEKWLKK